MRRVALIALLVAGCAQVHERDRADAGPRPDVGAGNDGGPVPCDEETLPEYAGPPCSDAVNACRAACASTDETCRDACLDAQCHACVYATIFHCANDAGCLSLWQTFACCVEGVPGCGALRGFDRTMCATSCPMQFQPYADCIPAMGGMECFLRAARNCGLH